jgi:hypothetical protein
MVVVIVFVTPVAVKRADAIPPQRTRCVEIL